jgi:hypothetical protein
MNRVQVWISSTLVALLTVSCGKLPGGSSSTGCVSNTVYSTQYAIGVNASNVPDTDVAQSFVAPGSTTSNIASVQIPLYLVGAVFGGGTFTVSIVPDASGPNDTVSPLATASVNLNTITVAQPANYTFTFPTAATLAGGTIYWLQVNATYPSSSTNYIAWAAGDQISGNAAIYKNGEAEYLSTGATPTWVAAVDSGREMGFSMNCQ